MARNHSLKLPGSLDEYTQESVKDLLKCATDPIYFIEKFCKIMHPTQGLVPFALYDYQKEVIQMYQHNRLCILLQSRQSGKSTVSAAYLLWFAIFHEHKNILIVSNKSSGSKEIMSRIVTMYENLPDFIRPAIDTNNWNKLSISFENKSNIIAETTTESSGRGLSISLVFCDEFGHLRSSIAEDFWTSISPALATGGSCIIASTANGSDNLYASLYRGAENGTNGFKNLFIPWNRVPGRDETFKHNEIAKIGEEKWRQEYECEFISTDPLLFSSIFVASYKVPQQPSPDARGILWYEEIERNNTYLIAMDPATGSGSDFTVMVMYSFPELKQVAEFRSNTTSTSAVYNILKYMLKCLMAKRVENVYWSFENNGLGESIIALYESDENPVECGELLSESGKKRMGFATTGKSKPKHCMNLKNLFEGGKLKVRSTQTVTEMKHFIRRNGSYAARNGSTDDTISAHIILLRILEELVQYEDKAYSLMYEDDFINEFDNEESYDTPPAIVGSGEGEDFLDYRNPWGNMENKWKDEASEYHETYGNALINNPYI